MSEETFKRYVARRAEADTQRKLADEINLEADLYKYEAALFAWRCIMDSMDTTALRIMRLACEYVGQARNVTKEFMDDIVGLIEIVREERTCFTPKDEDTENERA